MIETNAAGDLVESSFGYTEGDPIGVRDGVRDGILVGGLLNDPESLLVI